MKISLRKHYLSNNSCKKPSETEEEKNQKEPEVKYRCPGHPTCTFFGPLRLILIHMYKHPEANVKFRQGITERLSLPDCSCPAPSQIHTKRRTSRIRLKKSKLLPVKCEECSFHYTTRSSLSKHIEKKRCSKNKEHVKYAEAKIEKRRIKKLKNAGLHDSTKIEPIKISGETEVKSTQDGAVLVSEEELNVKQDENETEFRKIEIEMVKERIHGPIQSLFVISKTSRVKA